jgi:hypothetical protein
LPAFLGLGFVEPEGNRGSGHQVADLVRPCGGGATDDSDGNVVGVLRGVPGREKFADPGIEDPLERKPGIEQVVVDLSEGHRSHDWMAGGIVTTLDQQDPLCLRFQLMYAVQEIRRRWVSEPLIEDDERRVGAGRGLGTQPVKRGIRRCRCRYRVIRSEAVSDVMDQLLPDNLIPGHNKN